ncbi:hypothetical protein ColTof4_01157 [Colletotrichum tofieldiae]|nr:hypothetical protein ColTof4_01157 [Colletotrichum tofieldiae]GKT96750.1 hypothetical protein Ct61P_14600 [Colletotrichum tofieldiae]
MPKDKEPEVVVDGTLSSPNDAEARLTPPHPGGNITARVFLSHVFNATSQLCDAVPDWLVLSRSAPPEDVALLCLGLQCAVAELSTL